jgi:hypothetical protein
MTTVQRVIQVLTLFTRGDYTPTSSYRRSIARRMPNYTTLLDAITTSTDTAPERPSSKTCIASPGWPRGRFGPAATTKQLNWNCCFLYVALTNHDIFFAVVVAVVSTMNRAEIQEVVHLHVRKAIMDDIIDYVKANDPGYLFWDRQSTISVMICATFICTR